MAEPGTAAPPSDQTAPNNLAAPPHGTPTAGDPLIETSDGPVTDRDAAARWLHRAVSSASKYGNGRADQQAAFAGSTFRLHGVSMRIFVEENPAWGPAQRVLLVGPSDAVLPYVIPQELGSLTPERMLSDLEQIAADYRADRVNSIAYDNADRRIFTGHDRERDPVSPPVSPHAGTDEVTPPTPPAAAQSEAARQDEAAAPGTAEAGRIEPASQPDQTTTRDADTGPAASGPEPATPPAASATQPAADPHVPTEPGPAANPGRDPAPSAEADKPARLVLDTETRRITAPTDAAAWLYRAVADTETRHHGGGDRQDAGEPTSFELNGVPMRIVIQNRLDDDTPALVSLEVGTPGAAERFQLFPHTLSPGPFLASLERLASEHRAAQHSSQDQGDGAVRAAPLATAPEGTPTHTTQSAPAGPAPVSTPNAGGSQRQAAAPDSEAPTSAPGFAASPAGSEAAAPTSPDHSAATDAAASRIRHRGVPGSDTPAMPDAGHRQAQQPVDDAPGAADSSFAAYRVHLASALGTPPPGARTVPGSSWPTPHSIPGIDQVMNAAGLDAHVTATPEWRRMRTVWSATKMWLATVLEQAEDYRRDVAGDAGATRTTARMIRRALAALRDLAVSLLRRLRKTDSPAPAQTAARRVGRRVTEQLAQAEGALRPDQQLETPEQVSAAAAEARTSRTAEADIGRPSTAPRSELQTMIRGVHGHISPLITESPQWQLITSMAGRVDDLAQEHPYLGAAAMDLIDVAASKLKSDLQMRRGWWDDTTWHAIRLVQHAANVRWDDLIPKARPSVPDVNFYDGMPDDPWNPIMPGAPTYAELNTTTRDLLTKIRLASAASAASAPPPTPASVVQEPRPASSAPRDGAPQRQAEAAEPPMPAAAARHSAARLAAAEHPAQGRTASVPPPPWRRATNPGASGRRAAEAHPARR